VTDGGVATTTGALSFLANHSRRIYRLAARKGPDTAGGWVARDQRPAHCVRCAILAIRHRAPTPDILIECQ
jgi:hypothetical protein